MFLDELKSTKWSYAYSFCCLSEDSKNLFREIVEGEMSGEKKAFYACFNFYNDLLAMV